MVTFLSPHFSWPFLTLDANQGSQRFHAVSMPECRQGGFTRNYFWTAVWRAWVFILRAEALWHGLRKGQNERIVGSADDFRTVDL